MLVKVQREASAVPLMEAALSFRSPGDRRDCGASLGLFCNLVFAVMLHRSGVSCLKHK